MSAMEGFTVMIEKRVVEENVGYIEAVCDLARENDIEVEEIVDHVHPQLKEKIKIEFIKKNYFPDMKIEGTLDDFLKDD
jgi:hypothetical protein